MRQRARGFTLIEMSVALAVLSLVMLATVTALRTLGSTQVSLERITGRNDEIRSVSAFLRDAFESTVIGADSGGLSLGGGLARTKFEMTGSSLTWSTVMLFGESAGGNYVVRVAREGGEVVLRWQPKPARDLLQPWNKVPARTLITNVQSFDVAYRREPGGPWMERWDERGAPRWVRLRIRTGERYWPDIVMQVAR